jgi:hypothetical protein
VRNQIFDAGETLSVTTSLLSQEEGRFLTGSKFNIDIGE